MPWRIPIDLTWSGATGSPGVNIWHARASASPAEGDFDDTLTNLKAFYTACRGLFPTPVTIAFRGRITGVGPDVEKEASAPTWSVTGGSTTTAYLPPATAVTVSWAAATGGRSGKGRTFLGPLSPTIQDNDGRLAAAVAASTQSAINDLVAASTGASNGALGIWSPTDAVIRDFVRGTVRRDFASLRSRRD